MQNKFLIGALAVAGVAALMAESRKRLALGLGAVVDPLSVSDIASQLPAGIDAFIYEASRYVADTLTYEPVISSVEVGEEEIVCDAHCATPRAVIKRGIGNCWAASILLASILRHRLPPEQVFVVLGTLTTSDGEEGGHAWVEVFRDGDWYILESTTENPDAIKLWMKASEHKEYKPEYYFNDVISSDFDKKRFRIEFKACGCGCREARSWR